MHAYIITVCLCVRVPACEQNRSWAQMRGHVLSSDLRRCAPVPNEQEGHHYTRLILHRDLKPKNFFVTGGGPEAQPSSPFAVSIAVKIAVVFPSDVPRHGRFKMTAGSLQLGDFGLAKPRRWTMFCLWPGAWQTCRLSFGKFQSCHNSTIW